MITGESYRLREKRKSDVTAKIERVFILIRRS